ncbi:MAG TPA: indolepyruvate ferredoxin oxidoreductase subunit alpha, partial [Syntrophomonas sp.]|nr:indolepyruvate ferredoxin oxidoreductase subunit alpha [Syntrophomonas sp.]
EPVIEEQLKAWGLKVEGKELFTLLGEYSPEMIEEVLLGISSRKGSGLDQEIPPRPPLMCPGCPHRGVFHTLKKMKLHVMGDIGCYTLG